MAAVSETIVREYFELHGFLVRQQRKFIAPNRSEDEEIDFFVYNPQPVDASVPSAAGGAEKLTESGGRPALSGPLPFVLASADLPAIRRAVVVVKGWHTETFSQARLVTAPEIFRFVEPSVFQHAAQAFGGDGSLTKILVVPALPQQAEGRAQSLALLRSKGVDCVLPFRTMLADLVARIEINRNYQKSDLLQIIRILKNYGFLKEPQLELFKAGRKRKPASAAA